MQATTPVAHPKERIHKILSRAGICSRREAETLVREGLVTINGKAAEIGEKADYFSDAIKVRGKLIQKPRERVYLALNKPPKVLCLMGKDEERRRLTIRDFLGRYETAKLLLVGKVEYTGDGLVLLTNDGEMAQKLIGSSAIYQKFEVKIKGLPSEETLEYIRRGGRVDEKLYLPKDVKISRRMQTKGYLEIAFVSSLSLTMAEIKKFLSYRGVNVEHIRRIQIGNQRISAFRMGTPKLLNRKAFEQILDDSSQHLS